MAVGATHESAFCFSDDGGFGNSSIRMSEETGTGGSVSWLGFWAGVCVLVAALAGVLLWAWFTAGTDAFRVNGVPFRRWVAQRSDFQIQEPLAGVGSNAVPHLIGILRRAPESPRVYEWKQKIWSWLPRSAQSRFPQWQPVPDAQVRRTALFGIWFFGAEAKEALPYVVRTARSETNLMVRAAALIAALNIAPQAAETFALWREEWGALGEVVRNRG
jgi:hypothetical protein